MAELKPCPVCGAAAMVIHMACNLDFLVEREANPYAKG